MTRTLIKPFLSLSTVIICTLQHTNASLPEPFNAYLFAYFTGNSGNEEAIRFALSDDAHTFKALNENNPVLRSSDISSTGGVRDPHILRGENNDFYMVATDMVSARGWDSNRGLILLKSANLIDWTSSAITITETFPEYAKADRVWAPQVIFDPSAGKYMVYFAMRLGGNDRDKLYFAYADSTFTELESAPELLFEYGDNSAIDADIVLHDSTWHLFFKTEGSGNGIKKATSQALTKDYELYDKYLQLTNDAVEGSCVFKLIESDTWILMYDVYMAGKYEFALSTDLKHFTKDTEKISFDFHPRHGTIIPITENEKWRVLAKWNPTALHKKVPSVTKTAFNCRQTINSITFSGNEIAAGTTVALINLHGKVLVQQRITGSSVSITTAEIPAGIYLAVIRNRATRVFIGRIAVR